MRDILINIILILLIVYLCLPLAFCGLVYNYAVNKTVPVITMKK